MRDQTHHTVESTPPPVQRQSLSATVLPAQSPTATSAQPPPLPSRSPPTTTHHVVTPTMDETTNSNFCMSTNAGAYYKQKSCNSFEKSYNSFDTSNFCYDDDLSFDDNGSNNNDSDSDGYSAFGDDDPTDDINFDLLRQDDSPFYSNKRPVLYEGKSHLGVICQSYGSVWHYVFPYCIVNVLWTYAISWISATYSIQITLASTGHKFMVILVSYLVVSRVQNIYQRFVGARTALGECFRSSRELVHVGCILTLDSRGVGAVEWRKRLAEKTLRMLRITMAAINGNNPWDYLPLDERQMRNSNNNENKNNHPLYDSKSVAKLRHYKRTSSRSQRLTTHCDRTIKDERLHVPLIYSGILRTEILSPRTSNCLEHNMTRLQELKLLELAAQFTTAYDTLTKLITTPFPFPLVQKTRTILFVWLFTLPLSLLKDMSSPWWSMIMIFFVTYGFLGLEYVSIELDDPFGDDNNDFDNLEMAQRVYEDIYITLFDCDGYEAAENLRKTMSKKVLSTSSPSSRMSVAELT